MIKEIKNFVEKSANNFMEWIFQGEFKKFDNLVNELNQRHESPGSYDIKAQLAYLKEHLNGHKIPTHVNLDFNENGKIEVAGLTDNHNQDESN
jgi:hypothetical protein